MTDSYTDEGKPADMEATQKKSDAELLTGLAALKKLVEGK